jgi:hypothetical protein
MVNVRCIRCGVVNPVSDEVCKVCGADLAQPFRGPAYQSTSAQTHHRTTKLIRPFNGVTDVLSPAIQLFAKNLWLITKLVFVIVTPFEIFRVLSFPNETDWQLRIGLFVLDLTCNVLIAPALIYALMVVIRTGEAPGITESYRFGVLKLPKLILCATTAWLLQMLGLLFFIIPGIIISLSLQLVYPIAVLEKGTISATLRRSRDLTRGHRGEIFIAVLLMMVLVSIINLSLSAFLHWTDSLWALTVIAAIVNDILNQTTTVLSLVIYLSILRTLESGQSVIK